MLPPPLILPRRRAAPDSPSLPVVTVSAAPEAIPPVLSSSVLTSWVEPRQTPAEKEMQEAMERSLREQEIRMIERERKAEDHEQQLAEREKSTLECEQKTLEREQKTLERERQVAAREGELAQAETALWYAVEALQKIKTTRHA
jgi:hypothetical protein